MARRCHSNVWEGLVSDPVAEALAELADRCERNREWWEFLREARYHHRDAYREWREIVMDLGLGPILLRV